MLYLHDESNMSCRENIILCTRIYLAIETNVFNGKESDNGNFSKYFYSNPYTYILYRYNI